MGLLRGKTVVFTGRMEKTRREMELEARDLGAWVENGVTRRTDWLVTGTAAGRAKTEKAKQYNCDVITVDEYRRRIREFAKTADEAIRKQEGTAADTAEYVEPNWLSGFKDCGKGLGF